MIELVQGQLRLGDAPFDHRLTASWRADNAWKPLQLLSVGNGFEASDKDGGLRVGLVLERKADAWAYRVSFTSSQPTRIRVAIELPGVIDPFHLIPSFIFGDNNLAHVPAGTVPCLTNEKRDNPACSPYWECRADRASHPVSGAVWKGGLAAVSIDPFSDGRPIVSHEEDAAFIRNGLFAQLAHDGQHAACGATLGYGNLPRTYFAMNDHRATTAHFAREGTASGEIFLRRADDRRAFHAIVRRLYEQHRDTPKPPISYETATRDLTRAFLDINWHGENGKNADGSSFGVMTPFFGGKPFINNFTNMRCGDEAKTKLKAWRTLAEIGWSGGAAIGYPILFAGALLGDATAVKRGAYKLDTVADATNPATGLLFDVAGVEEGKRLNWWWSAPPIMDCHCVYTNASAVYYLLKSAAFVRNSHAPSLAPLAENAKRWAAAALRALDAAIALQLPDGNLGFTYRGDRLEMLDAEGFAGAWFIPGLALAYMQTRDRRYLDAGERALRFYHRWVRDLFCWGTPMDVGKMVDHEGNLGFIRGALLMSEATGSREFLDATVDGADFEYLWRYGIRSRPQYRPLRGSPFNSCGGSITSSATSMHPMGVYVSEELRRLGRATGDDYHTRRADDALNWAANCVSLYPEHTGYGTRGVITERWCASDGMGIESFPDGTPSGMWFSYNGWAAAAILEGLGEAVAGEVVALD